MANEKKQYSEKERRLYWMGVGSTMSHSAQGREKQVRSMTGNNTAEIASYKRGRAEGQRQKQAYLNSRKTARGGKKKR